MNNATRWAVTLAAIAVAVAAIGYALSAPATTPPRPPVSAPPDPTPAPPDQTPVPPPPIQAPAQAPPTTLQVQVEVLANGDARVYERLQSGPAADLWVARPHELGRLPWVTTPQQPEVVDPQFTIDGRPYAPVEEGGGWTITASSPAPAPRQVELGYVIRGSAVRTTPGPPGRAVVVVEPLLLPHARGMPVRLVVAEPFVRGVSCPLFPLIDAVCANRRPEGWTVESAAANPDTLQWIALQVDLPA